MKHIIKDIYRCHSYYDKYHISLNFFKISTLPNHKIMDIFYVYNNPDYVSLQEFFDTHANHN